KVLLSDLSFAVNDRPARIDLAGGAEKLVWTGRVRDGEEVAFAIAYRGRGLAVAGGRNYDYADGVVSAAKVDETGDGVKLAWEFASLESGVPVGVIVPSEKSFDRILATMTRRSWATFLGFFA